MLNQCNFIGRLGADPECRYSQDGTAFTNFSIACTESWKDKKTGDKKERTEWVKVTVAGRLAEVANEYLRKGSLVFVSGKMQTRKWQDRDGQDRYTTEIRATEMKMLGGRSENESGGNNFQRGGNAPSRNNDPFADQPDFNDVPVDDSIPF